MNGPLTIRTILRVAASYVSSALGQARREFQFHAVGEHIDQSTHLAVGGERETAVYSLIGPAITFYPPSSQ